MLMIVLLDGSGFNLNAHRSETEQNGAAAQSLMLIHIVHSVLNPSYLDFQLLSIS